MLAKPLTITILGIILTTSSYADSLLHNFIPSKQRVFSEHSDKKIAKNADYADFSGDWVGKCDNQPDDEMVTIHIKNDSNNITIDGQHYDINGVNSNTGNSYYLTEGEHTSIRWNEDRSSLLLNGVYFSQVHHGSDSARLETAIIHGSFSIANNQLILKTFVQAYTDGEAEGTLNRSCIYSK